MKQWWYDNSSSSNDSTALVGLGLLTVKASRLHSGGHATLSRTPMDEWSARRRDNTQHSQETDIHAPGGIRTHDPSKRAAVDRRLRPHGHGDRQAVSIITAICFGRVIILLILRVEIRLNKIRKSRFYLAQNTTHIHYKDETIYAASGNNHSDCVNDIKHIKEGPLDVQEGASVTITVFRLLCRIAKSDY